MTDIVVRTPRDYLADPRNEVQRKIKEIAERIIGFEDPVMEMYKEKQYLQKEKHYLQKPENSKIQKKQNEEIPLNSYLPITIKINNFLNSNMCNRTNLIKHIINISLLYHIFVYIYLGVTKSGGALYTGIMYSIMYSGALLAYWIIYRQNNPLITWENIISSELVTNTEERMKIRGEKIENQTFFSKFIKNFNNRIGDKENKLTQFEFMDENIDYLLTNKSAIKSFYIYCKQWEITGVRIYLTWGGIALSVMIAKALPDHILDVGKGFDDEPISLWGYYNLSGQFIASLGIVNASIIMLTGFYQMQCMILNFASRIREWRKKEVKLSREIENAILEGEGEGEERQQRSLTREEKKQNLEKKKQEIIFQNFTNTRDEYLYLQKCCVTLSDIWSAPVVAIIFFCTAVIITNLFVINYELTKCEGYSSEDTKIKDYCDFFIGYSFIWMASALGFGGVLLYGISSINTATSKIKRVFICSNNGLTDLAGENHLVKPEYHAIGGRDNWLQYLDSNPIHFTIYGITVTSTYAVNTGYAVGSTIGTFLISYLFTDDSEL